MAYYYTRDHLGSVRELCSSTGSIGARYAYDPYGRTTVVSGTNLATIQYAGYYAHQTSGLYFTKYRAFDPNSGRWLGRDPIAEAGGLNLYGYVGNSPIDGVDPLGLFLAGWQVSAGAEAGIGPGAGFATQAGWGAGFTTNFNGNSNGSWFNSSPFGGFQSAGAFIGTPLSSLQYPNTGQTNWVFGASGGGGQGVWFSNANNVSKLSGPFKQWSFNNPILSVSIALDPATATGWNPFSWTWMSSFTFLTRGEGVSASAFSTTTKTLPTTKTPPCP